MNYSTGIVHFTLITTLTPTRLTPPHLPSLIRIPLSGVGRHILSVHPLVLAGVKEILDSFRKT